MPRTYKKKTAEHWSQKALQDALVDHSENYQKSTIYQGLHWRDMYVQQKKVYH